MGDARSEVPLAVLQDRPGSTAPVPAPAPTPPPAEPGSDPGQQEVSPLALAPLSAPACSAVSCCTLFLAHLELFTPTASPPDSPISVDL